MENESFVIDQNLQSANSLGVNIYSLDGNLISSMTLDQGQHEFSADFLKAGVYIFEFNADGEMTKEIFVVSK